MVLPIPMTEACVGEHLYADALLKPPDMVPAPGGDKSPYYLR
jgi:hypothetical protein